MDKSEREGISTDQLMLSWAAAVIKWRIEELQKHFEIIEEQLGPETKTWEEK